MERKTTSRRSAQIHEEACEWFVEFRAGEPSEALRKAYLAWLQESPTHMAAYLEVAALWHDTAAVNRDGRWTVDELMRQAAVDADNVVSLEAASTRVAVTDCDRALSPVQAVPAARNRIRTVFVSLAASILFVVIIGTATWYTERGTYSTDFGEQRSVTLADGSTVQLNARTKLRVRFTERERGVELIRGQALFQVAKNPARPFVVTSGDTRVRAVGTQFDVYQKRRGTVVTVVEGKVAVFGRRAGSAAIGNDGVVQPKVSAQHGSARESEASAQPILVSAGERLTVWAMEPATAGSQIPEPINVTAATAWTQRQLVFESTPLSEVVDEFNRYNERQLVIHDAALGSFQIDGVFSSTDPASLIQFLRARAGVQVTETSSAIVLARQTTSP